MNEAITYKTIGYVSSPYKNKDDIKVLNLEDRKAIAEVHLNPEYTEGLEALEGFSHIILITHMDRNPGVKMKVKPVKIDYEVGVFATRATSRPNPIALSTVKLLEINNNIIKVEGVDLLDNTPLIDIKPYVTKEGAIKDLNLGWLENAK